MKYLIYLYLVLMTILVGNGFKPEVMHYKLHPNHKRNHPQSCQPWSAGETCHIFLCSSAWELVGFFSAHSGLYRKNLPIWWYQISQTCVGSYSVYSLFTHFALLIRRATLQSRWPLGDRMIHPISPTLSFVPWGIKLGSCDQESGSGDWEVAA